MKNDALSAFDEKLAKASMYGQWQADELLQSVIDGPRPAGVPHVWHWNEVAKLLDEACAVMPESLTARRSLMFTNPELPRGTTHTLAMGIQMILPGEVAWAHRHSISALRFAIEGDRRLYTVVDGEPCIMEDHDLVLTPGWTWHDHHNESDRRACWLDVLDVPLMLALNQPFYEPLGETTQPLREAKDARAARFAPYRPVWERTPETRIPVRYPWAEMEARLRLLANGGGSPYDGVALEYANPLTGGPTLATLTCWAQWLKPGLETRPHRRTSSAVVHVVRGRGRSVIGDSEITWGPRDSFCIPNWTWHHHVNASASEEAILFSVHDIPVMRALGLYVEEPENSLQAVAPAAAPADAGRPGHAPA